MKSMSHISMLILAAVLFLFVAACGAPDDPPETTTDTTKTEAPKDPESPEASKPDKKEEKDVAKKPAAKPKPAEPAKPKPAQPKPAQPKPKQEPAKQTTQTPAPAPAQKNTDSTPVKVTYDTGHPDPWYFAEPSTDYDQSVMFYTSEPVTDFHFFVVDWGDPNAGGNPMEGDVLYTQPELLPNDDLQIVTSFPGDMPSRGISYTNDSGARKAFTLSMSGMDGSLVLTPMY